MEGLTPDHTTPQGGETPTGAGRRATATVRLITALSALWLGALAGAWSLWGPSTARWQALLALLALALLSWLFAANDVESRVSLSISSIVVLAGAAMIGPIGAAIVGAAHAALHRGRIPAHARVFNVVMSSLLGLIAGGVFLAAGGSTNLREVTGTGPIVAELLIPLAVSNVAMALANVLLIAMVVRADQGVPMRLSTGRLLSSTVPMYLGYGVIAFLLVVLWRPVGLGPISAAFIVVPLLGARWAYLQHAEERRAHNRALDALVAAIELKSPHLTGHSSRVAALATAMAEVLGLGPAEVSDVQTAATLHDVGQVTLPTALVRKAAAGEDLTSHEAEVLSSYPGRSLELVGGLSFLAGALDAIARHQVPSTSADPSSVPGHLSLQAHIVGVADRFDLLTRVGVEGARPLGEAEAITMLRSVDRPGQSRIVDALEAALVRREEALA